jgi:DNA-binding LacI/PurR family transcriptional regulator
MARIHEVAKEAEVSITTVSHVFSGRRPVAPETQKRVREAARRLGYSPHSVARGLATGRSMTLAIAFPFDDDSLVLDPYFGRLLEGYSGAAAEAGYGFLLVPTSPRRSEFPLRRLLSEGRFDGAIVADPAEHDDLIPILIRHGVPVVTTGRFGSETQVPWVDNDNRGGMGELLRHLGEMGYTKPALISMSTELSYSRDIDEVFREMVGAGASLVHTRDVTELAGYNTALELLHSDDPPDAIIASSDRQALGALRAAQELGLDVPEEIGIAGAGDTLAAHAHPPITSIVVQIGALAEAAVAALMTLLDGVETPENTVLPTKLAIRESTDRQAAVSRHLRSATMRE